LLLGPWESVLARKRDRFFETPRPFYRSDVSASTTASNPAAAVAIRLLAPTSQSPQRRYPGLFLRTDSFLFRAVQDGRLGLLKVWQRQDNASVASSLGTSIGIWASATASLIVAVTFVEFSLWVRVATARLWRCVAG
jgi:hypothetical protein